MTVEVSNIEYDLDCKNYKNIPIMPIGMRIEIDDDKFNAMPMKEFEKFLHGIISEIPNKHDLKVTDFKYSFEN